MKVLLLNQIPEVNNKYSFSLARGLKKNGINICVCGIDTDDVSEYSDIPFLEGFESYSSCKSYFEKVKLYKNGWENVLRHCRINNIDVVHVQWYIFSPMDYIYISKLKRMGIKVVATIHDLLPFNKKFYDFYFHKKIYTSVDAVITQAQMNIEDLVSIFKVKKDKIFYVPHGHYMEYAEKIEQNVCKDYLGLPHDKKIILFFGQIKKVKGVDVLIKAMEIVSKEYDDVLCVIAGKVWKDDFSTYRQMIKNGKLEQNVRCDIKFIPDEEIKYYFNASDMIVLPYLQIYQSGVVLLAYAYEKPVIATKLGEFVNVIKDNETGLLVEPGDDEALANAIKEYINNPKKAEIFGVNGKKDINSRLSWDNISSDIVKIYMSVM